MPVAEAAPPPADPLADLTPEQRWRWAVDRYPRLGAMDRSPLPRFESIAPGGRITLFSPDLVDGTDADFRQAPCTRMDFEIAEGRLVTRIPMRGGPARPDLPSHYVEFSLGETAELGVHVTQPNEGAGMTSSDGPVSLLSAFSAEAIRYQGVWLLSVECRDMGRTRECRDGTTSRCPRCALVFRPYGVPNIGEIGVFLSREMNSPCGPCPPDPYGPIEESLRRIVIESRVVEVSEDLGPSFFSTPAACRAAIRRGPRTALESDMHTYGFPLHPELVEVCDRAPVAGRGVSTVYETSLPPGELVAWHRRQGGALQRDGDVHRLRTPVADGATRWLAIGPKASFDRACPESFAEETRTVVEFGVDLAP